MATVNKDFKIKSGLIVEGASGTINGNAILTEVDGDAYILDLIGGETLITSVDSDQLQVISGELSVKDGVFDADGAAATAEENANAYTDNRETAITTAYQSYADTAESDAKAYTDTRETAITTAYQSYADTAESDAIASANSYTDGEITTALGTAQGYANTAESNANDYTDTALEDYTTTANLDTAVDGLGYLKSADLSGYATESYVSTAVDNLVDGAPGLLDTLNELAAAINDDANYATTMTTALAGKQENLTAGTGITLVDGDISVTANTYDAYGAATTAQTNAEDYADGLASNYDAAGSASTAEQNAKDYADNLSSNYDIAGSAEGAYNNATSYTDTAIGNLTTDDIEEGDSLYFTDNRASNAAATLLTNATTTNLTITGNSVDGLVITAENGVGDSTTDDLEEGENNLYFTDERAQDAISGVNIYPASVIINNLSKEVAGTSGLVATASQVTALSWAKDEYRSAKLLVKCAYGTHTEISEVLLTLDTSDNIAITEYATVGTNGSAMTITADVNGTDVRVRVTTANNNSTVNVFGTLIA